MIFGMSYLCRCGKEICHSQNSCRTPKNPFFQGFSDFFQHPTQDFSPVFNDFFHKATTREFFRCAIRLFRVSAYLRITFPHSYPHLVDNFCSQPHILSSPVDKSIFTNDISMTQRRHFPVFSCFKLENQLFLIPFSIEMCHFHFSTGLFHNVWEIVWKSCVS